MSLGVALVVTSIALSVAQRVLLKPPKPIFQSGPRFDDFAVQTGSEGSPLKRGHGRSVRLAGTVIWSSDPDQEVDAMGQTQTYIDLAIAICDHEIADISRVYAEDRVLFGSDVTVTVTTNDVAIIPLGAGRGQIVNNVSAFGGVEVDLTVFNAATPITIAGLTSTYAVYNGTWRVGRVAVFDPSPFIINPSGTPTTFIEIDDPAWPDGPTLLPEVQTMTIEQDQQSFAEGVADSVTYYLGTTTQTADPLIEAHEGAGNVPGYRGIAYAVFERFRITEYGSRIPSMSFLVHETLSSDSPVSDHLASYCTARGIPSYLIDASEVSGNLQGHEIDRPQALADALSPLLIRFDLVAFEDQGLLVFRPRSRSSVDAEVTIQDVSARSNLESRYSPTRRRDAVTTVPQEVVVNYSDPEKGYLRGTQRERFNSIQFRQGSGDVALSQSEEVRNLPVVMSGVDARIVASRELWLGRTRNVGLECVLPASLSWVRIGDAVAVDFGDDRVETHLVQQRTEDPKSGRVSVVMESVEPQVVAQTGATIIPAVNEPTPFTGSGYSWRLHDPTNFADETLGRFWLSVTRGNLGQPWISPQLWYSTDDVNYSQIGAGIAESTAGSTIDAESGTGELAAPSSFATWDRENFVDVNLGHGSLSTVTEAAVLQGANRALLGDEVIAFTTATLIGPRSYRLSNLLRGLRGTEHNAASHYSGERFVMTSTLTGLILPGAILGMPLHWKVIAPGQSLASVPAEVFTVSGLNRRPFAPLYVTGVRDSSGNLAISWTRRTRRVHQALHVPTPLEETSEVYRVDVSATSGGAVVRSMSVTGATSVTYTAFQQALDSLFLSTQYIRVYQIGAFGVGLGSDERSFA